MCTTSTDLSNINSTKSVTTVTTATTTTIINGSVPINNTSTTTAGIQSKIPKPIAGQKAASSTPETGAVASMLTHLHDPKMLTTHQTPPSLASIDAQKDYKDPLRELVLISEAICINEKDTAFMTNVKTLAKEATTLDHIKEVVPEQAGIMPLSPAPLGSSVTTAPAPPTNEITSTTFNLFQDPKDMVDPVKEREFLKKLEALDEADSEGFDGLFFFY